MTNDGNAHVSVHASHHLDVRAIPLPGEKRRDAPLEKLSLLPSHPVYRVDKRHEAPPPSEAGGEALILLYLPRVLENL